MINEVELSYQDLGLMTKNSVAIPLVGVFADVEIIGKSSKVKITQKFKNTNKKAVEAIYKFHLPENAAIIGFKILLKSKVIKGVIEEKDKAFKTYDDALIKGNGAVLLDQERPNIFTLSVGNLNPGNEVSIEIEYISVLDFKNNILRFFLPTTISPRYVPDNMPDEDGIPIEEKIHPEYAAKVSYGLNLKINILKIKGLDLTSVSSPSHKIKTSISDKNYLIEFTNDNIMMDRDFILEAEYKSSNINNAFYYKGQDDSFIQVDFAPDLKDLLQGSTKDFLPVKREVVFVLDCSGSMTGSSINQAKKALEILIKALEPGQRFNIYRFGSHFDKLADEFLEFGDKALNLALKFLKKTDADFGGTEILMPLKDIILNKADNTDYNRNKDKNITKNTNIVLITDGEVGNEKEVIDLVRSNKQYFRVFTIGIGYGPNEYFVKNMADSTGGENIMVHPEERIDLKIISLFKNINMGAIENLKIDLGTNENLIDQAPKTSVVFDNNNYSIYAKIKSDSIPESLTLKGLYNSKEISWKIPSIYEINKDGKINKSINYIPKFWAWEKIRELESGSLNVLGSQQKERKKNNINNLIVDLSKKYGVVSSKTSFVSVEERSEEEKTTGEVDLVKVPTLITHGWHGKDAIEKAKIRSVYKRKREDGVRRYFTDFSVSKKRKQLKPKCLHNTSCNSKSIPKSKAKEKRQLKGKILLEILLCQMPEGGFKISNNLNKLLKINQLEVERLGGLIVTNKTKINLNEKRRLLETTLIIAILNEYFISSIDSWKSIIGKSEAWLTKMTHSHLEIKPLRAYIAKYVKNLSF